MRKEDGFTVLEMLVAMVILAVSLAVSLPVGTRWLTHFGLEASTVRTIEDLRWCQELAVSADETARTQFAPYSPEYKVYQGSTELEHVGFDSSTNYYGGYLQTPFSRVQYDGQGASQQSGVMRLAAGRDVASITFYMSSGLQALSGLP